jgi:hypothetical protein
MDHIALLLGQHGHELLVVRHHARELVLRAAADVEKERNEPDPFGQQATDLLRHAGPHGRVDHPDDAAPAGK